MNLQRSCENERDLFVRIGNSDAIAFSQVFHAYNRRLYPFVFKLVKSEALSEDIIQDIFAKLWANRHLLPDVENPKSYIFTIAANVTKKQLKLLAKENLLMTDSEHWPVKSESNNTEEVIFLKESEQVLSDAVGNLPPQRQLIYRLSREEGKSYDEIAEKLNISKNTVRNQLVEALKVLRKAMHNAAGLIVA
jgi:RNA polymerase sigma-70 factor (ECF subfamily)